MEAFLDAIGLVDPALRKAAVPALFNAFGILFAALIGIVSWIANRWWERRQDDARRQRQAAEARRLRQQKRYDVAVALKAEIDAILGMQRASLSADQIAETQKSFMEEGEEFDPYTFPGLDNSVYSLLEGDLPTLRADVIAAIVKFYRLDRSSNAALAQMNTELFRSLPNKRQMRAVKELEMLAAKALEAGDDAIATLGAYVADLAAREEMDTGR